MSATLRPPALLFGIPIDDLTMDDTLDVIGDLVAHGRATGATHQLATVNVDFLVNALADPELKTILQSAALCIADGMPVVWGARALGMPIRERVAGSDLVPRLIDRSRSTGHHVHVLGSTESVAEQARAVVADRFPGACFSVDPGPVFVDVGRVDDEVFETLDAIDPDILCVALGNPKQERFIHLNRARLRAPVMIGVGGSLDLFVGKRRRAPTWLQRIGMEWIVRALQEPQRLGRRYAHDIRVFGPEYARAWRHHRQRRAGAGLQLSVVTDAVAVRLEGRQLVELEAWQLAADGLVQGASLDIDAAGAASVSEGALAQLVGLVRIANRLDATIAWRHADERLRHWVSDLGLPLAPLGLERRSGSVEP